MITLYENGKPRESTTWSRERKNPRSIGIVIKNTSDKIQSVNLFDPMYLFGVCNKDVGIKTDCEDCFSYRELLILMIGNGDVQLDEFTFSRIIIQDVSKEKDPNWDNLSKLQLPCFLILSKSIHKIDCLLPLIPDKSLINTVTEPFQAIIPNVFMVSIFSQLSISLLGPNTEYYLRLIPISPDDKKDLIIGCGGA